MCSVYDTAHVKSVVKLLLNMLYHFSSNIIQCRNDSHRPVISHIPIKRKHTGTILVTAAYFHQKNFLISTTPDPSLADSH